jgi:protein-tyrosine phosphatase
MRVLVFLLVLWLASPVLAQSSDAPARAFLLKGTRNTRELGGLPVRGGVFALGKVYRSGALCFASREDASKLQATGLHTILELRLKGEIDKDGPDKEYLTRGVEQNLHWPMGNSRGLGKEAYISYMEDNGPLFARFFQLLANQDSYPLLFHCSAGKDRTGILTALLLDFLGTPREIIYDDYLHSKRITPKLRVEREWLDAVFAIVDEAGGIEPYLRAQGVSPQVFQSVRQNLIVGPNPEAPAAPPASTP